MKATTSSSVITTKLYYIIKVENVRWISTSTKYRLEEILQEVTFGCTKWRRILYLNIFIIASNMSQYLYAFVLCWHWWNWQDQVSFNKKMNYEKLNIASFSSTWLARSSPSSEKKIILPKVRPPSHTTYFYGTWHETKHKIINTVDCTVLIN